MFLLIKCQCKKELMLPVKPETTTHQCDCGVSHDISIYHHNYRREEYCCCNKLVQVKCAELTDKCSARCKQLGCRCNDCREV